MTRFVSVSKAAILVGVSSRDIQVEIDNGKLPSVRGMVHIDDLAELHPEVSVEEADMVNWVRKIRDSSLQSATEKLDHELTKSELQKMLARARTEISYSRDKIEAYEHLLNELRYSLTVIQKNSSEPNKVQSLISWIDQKLHN